MKLEGKHVLIVGGSSGIGFAVARQAASAGARVTIASSRKTNLDGAPSRLPGVVRTPLWDHVPVEQREAFFNMVAKSLPVQQVGEPDDVAEAYLYLMKSAYTTGQILVLDGGKSLA